MNNSDVLLILPPGGYYAERWKAGSLQPPLGLFYLAAVLEQNGYRVAIIDAHLEGLTVKGVVARTAEINPKVIGLSFATDNRFPAFATIEALKQHFPQTPLVLGGPHPSLTAEDTLTHIKGVDYIVRGEGEVVFVKLLQGIFGDPSSIAGIPGVSWRKDGVPVHNPRQELIADLDTLPFPARHLHPFDKYNLMMDVPGVGLVRGATMLAARGCPFSCNFCSSSEMWGRRVRPEPLPTLSPKSSKSGTAMGRRRSGSSTMFSPSENSMPWIYAAPSRTPGSGCHSSARFASTS